jgi:hypothetical protein
MWCIVVEQCDLATLKVGDHLKVMRRRFDVVPYAHHGIYEGDGHVIDFGSGSWDGVTRKTLAEFRGKSLAVKLVQHGRGTLATGYLFPAVEPEEIVARARFLLANSPFPQRYNLIGLNCEHVANWCAAGGYCESHQTRFGFHIKAYLTLSFGIYIAVKQRRGRAPSGWDTAFAVLNLLLSLLVRRIYNQQIKRFYEWANPTWEAWVANREASSGKRGRGHAQRAPREPTYP